MNILMIFADMLGAEYINLGNSNQPLCSIDILMKELGGTLFYNCFTPAPDTPRSSACMWTGLYPKKNGCDNRLKYPGEYLKPSFNFWNAIEEAGYVVNAYVKASMNRIGLLPSPYGTYVHYDSYNESISHFLINDKSFSFVYLPDLHLMMDVNGYNQKMFIRGTEVVTSCISDLFSILNIDRFDYVIIFSDHGFRIEKKEHLIENDRIRTLMFIHKRGDTGIKIDYNMRSNLDICPTIMDIINRRDFPPVDGKSLFGEGHKSILIEDHEDFSVKLGQTIEHWAVIDQNGKHWLECSGKWEHEKQNVVFDEKYWESIISENMSDYAKNHELYTTLHKYDEYKDDNNVFSNGEMIKVRFSRRPISQRVLRIKDGLLHYLKS